MKVLVIGNGGREHAIAWKLLQSANVQQVICVPGNGGTASTPRCLNLAMNVLDFEGIARFALVNGVDLVVVGPEVPLAAGVTDYLQSQGLTVFGPTRLGAQIEASKAWAKDLMREANIPTAEAVVFIQANAALAYVQKQGAPIVIKADGLAAGKGVTVAMTIAEAEAAIADAFGGKFGEAGQRVVIEECLTGQEVSVLAVTDGLTIRPLLPAQDHKRIGEGDTGANTGGMGAYAPAPIATPQMMERIQQEILEPAIATLRKRQIDYRGVLYAGLMITPSHEPKVIEFNCRFGDPETQVVLPLLETPLADLLLACAEQRLEAFPPLEWTTGAAACVVMAAGGYPDAYEKGKPITGIEQAENQDAIVFHAGTQKRGQAIVTDGGRVLNVVATGASLDGAIANAYTALNSIQFDDMYFRRDIGFRAKIAQ
ncbi:MAG: phosphoribosylamine--glycine ligase [Leptolyngbyaceae cyanobacterium bins.302]|nr:phosphoribosylamine--glycine ligase [Leptolyngbyaceae cyanobacterium bins.302]